MTATALTGLNGNTAMIARECANCGKRITERFLLKALDLFWHEDCLKCGCCDCRLGEVGSTLYTKANLILCKRDYLRLVRETVRVFRVVLRRARNIRSDGHAPKTALYCATTTLISTGANEKDGNRWTSPIISRGRRR